MTGESSYRINAPTSSIYVKDWNVSPFNMAELVRRGVLVPDTRLQTLTDAWNQAEDLLQALADARKALNLEEVEWDTWYDNPEAFNALFRLLDALTEEASHEPSCGLLPRVRLIKPQLVC